MYTKITKLIFIICIILFSISFFQKKKLPDSSKVLPELSQEPIQIDTNKKEFSFNYRGTKYNVNPLFDYELWGLIVTHNDINKWYNFYHDENSVNVKDVCVVWGKNVENNNHIGPTFKSGEWTCYTKISGKYFKSGKNFRGNQLSNNHLLSNDSNIIDIIGKMHVGDQIHLKGMLVDYGTDERGYYRRTSISRNDTNQSSRSGGACEVFYVDEAEILEEENHIWYLIEKISLYIFCFILLVKFINLIRVSQKLKTKLVKIEE